MQLVYQYMAIFFIFSPDSNHLHPLQVENCNSISRLVVNEDDNVKSGLKGLTSFQCRQHNDLRMVTLLLYIAIENLISPPTYCLGQHASQALKIKLMSAKPGSTGSP